MIDEEKLLYHLRNVSNNVNEFDYVYESTKGLLYRTIYTIILDHHEAEDILQETYLKILHHDWFKKDEHNIIAFMITVAKNLALSALKVRKKQISLDVNENEDLFKSDHQDESESPLLKLLPTILKNDELIIFQLHVLEGLTHKEIAKILKKPLGTITWKYNQTIKKLQRKVGNIYG